MDPTTGAFNTRETLKNHDFRSISRFISEMIRDRAIISINRQWELITGLSNDANFSDLE